MHSPWVTSEPLVIPYDKNSRGCHYTNCLPQGKRGRWHWPLVHASAIINSQSDIKMGVIWRVGSEGNGECRT